jgi:uncharacterized protein YdhG (YjbR/CyaY superfamily)
VIHSLVEDQGDANLKEHQMIKARKQVASIDEYIQSFPKEIQKLLSEMRLAIRASAPEAIEKISYQIPTFYLNGNLVHFAAFKNHIGFYPTPSGISAFKDELKEYKSAKGSVQFPLNKPLPLDLIRRIVAFRVKENNQKSPRNIRR